MPRAGHVPGTNDRDMNMLGRFQRSWHLFQASLAVLRQQPKLLAFPVVIAGCTAGMLLFFLAPLILQPTGFGLLDSAHWQAVVQSIVRGTGDPNAPGGEQFALTRLGLAYLAALYLASMILATFFNVAFYHEIMAALGGGTVSIRRGLAFAGSRWVSILAWSLFAGLVGMLIKLIEQKLEFVGRLLARIIGLGWSVASVFVIPALIRSPRTANPVEMLQRSATTLRRTWGETLIGYAGLAFGNVLVAVLSVFWVGGAIAIGAMTERPALILAMAGVWLVALSLYAYLTGVASQVYRGALYLYAAEGVVPNPYSREQLDLAWKFRKP